MRRIFTSVAPTVITGIVGLITLLSFVLPGLGSWRVPLINIAIVVTGVALLIGFIHLLSAHLRRFRRRGNLYSLLLILTALIAFVILVAERVIYPAGPDRPISGFVLNSLIVPMQSALGALLAVFLAMAAFRMAQRRRTWGMVWFLVSALVVLFTQIPIGDGTPGIMTTIRDFFNAVTTGGMRGLLLGVALGTLAVAFRVLFAIDRPQSE